MNPYVLGVQSRFIEKKKRQELEDRLSTQIANSTDETLAARVTAIEAALVEEREKVNHDIAYTYNARGLVETETWSGGVSRTASYTYGTVEPTLDKILTETITTGTDQLVRTYTYDQTTGKTLSVTAEATPIESAANYEVAYVYNATTGLIESETWTGDIQQTISYTYDGGNRLLTETTVTATETVTKTHTYDVNGVMTGTSAVVTPS